MNSRFNSGKAIYDIDNCKCTEIVFSGGVLQLIKGKFIQNEYPFWLTKFINKVKIQVCFYAK